MNKPTITSVTVSCEFGAEGDYGKGTKSFMNMSGKYPEPGVDMEQIDDVILSGLDMYLAAWKTILTGRCATGIVGGKEWKKRMVEADERVGALRNVLKKLSDPEYRAAVLKKLAEETSGQSE